MRKILYIISFLLIVHCTLNTEDCMSQWIQQGVPTNQVIQDMHFLDSLNGWLVCSNGAVLDSGIILRTTDGGESWIKQYGADSTPLLAIKMADINTGYCVGGFRKILKTTNGGDNWINVNNITGGYLNNVEVINKDTLYIGDRSSSPVIYKSTNGGLNFTGIYSGLDCRVMYFINEQTGWAGVSGFNFVKTTNGGQNWVTLRTFPSSVRDLFFLDENTGWLIGGEGTGVLKTTNGGTNFIFQNLPGESNGAFTIFMLNHTTGWIGGAGNQIHKTINGGDNWLIQSVPIFTSYAISFVDSLIGWCGRGGLSKTTNGGATSIVPIDTEIPSEYSLKQNYPNPFNPTTTIEFNISNTSVVNLKVYSILGKEIILYSKRILSPGTYKAVFDGSNLSSGVYYYTLRAQDTDGKNNYTTTKKMILVK